MERYKYLFQKLHSSNNRCLIPFLTIGDPSLKLSYKIIYFILKKRLAHALELGIPFSDPLADGQIIQKANIRALKSNITLKKCFFLIKNIRNIFKKIPIGILIYANMVYQKGIQNFFYECYVSGIDSVIIPDVPIEENQYFKKTAELYGIHFIIMCPPDADKDLLEKISMLATGFIYLLSRTGVTGNNKTLNTPSILKTIEKLKKYTSTPLIQGFGISKIEHIEYALKNKVSGIVCGSAIISIIEHLYEKKPHLIFKKMHTLLSSFKKTTIYKK
ncbi:tryptophan synthase subunit alpha [Buchnera aphidicola]|uniref:Tryptophan synthase alpha chain n=1 Tax=Buchnera aphidicola (Anoecia oenotherae) TaxID=1241833 RepID=A0A4D6XPV2_9GAMM|nr:tryptophan synthase subunit alpha [Buchnera aphidicola]QCI19342.1 tryptophan synthase subunit alpha [Buchnera aphidicola (Anoecia oenotherae)]